LARDAVGDEDTWPFLLRQRINSSNQTKELVTVINLSEPGILIVDARKRLNDFMNQLQNDRDDIVIIALGIVDAAPQPFTYYLQHFRSLPFIGLKIWGKIKPWLVDNRAMLQGFASFRFTSPSKFQKELRQIIKLGQNRGTNVYVLETPIPHSFLNTRSPGLFQSVNQYNIIKFEVSRSMAVTYISLEFPESHYLSPQDGHHFSAEGHSYIGERIWSYLNGM